MNNFVYRHYNSNRKTKIMLLNNIKILHFPLKTLRLYLYKIWIQYIVQLLSNNKHCHKTMSCAIIIRYCIHSYTNLAERHNGNESQLGSKKLSQHCLSLILIRYSLTRQLSNGSFETICSHCSVY